MKKYPIKKTKKLLQTLKPYWKSFNLLRDSWFEKQVLLVKLMQAETGIEDIEFIQFDGDYAGIGNTSRTMKLIPPEELE